jgi:hypothetical protein
MAALQWQGGGARQASRQPQAGTRLTEAGGTACASQKRSYTGETPAPLRRERGSQSRGYTGTDESAT